MRKLDPDNAWRWVLRIAGLAGIFVGANASPPWPSVAFIVFAAMIGLDQFIATGAFDKKKNGKDKHE